MRVHSYNIVCTAAVGQKTEVITASLVSKLRFLTNQKYPNLRAYHSSIAYLIIKHPLNIHNE